MATAEVAAVVEMEVAYQGEAHHTWGDHLEEEPCQVEEAHLEAWAYPGELGPWLVDLVPSEEEDQEVAVQKGVACPPWVEEVDPGEEVLVDNRMLQTWEVGACLPASC